MSNQEHEEQAQGLGKFHDKHSYQKPPDWLKAEAEAEARETADKTHFYDLGHHTVGLDERGTLVLYESSTRMTLSADEAHKLLVWLSDNYPNALRTSAHSGQGQQSKQRLGIDAEDVSERAHEDWANDE